MQAEIGVSTDKGRGWWDGRGWAVQEGGGGSLFRRTCQRWWPAAPRRRQLVRRPSTQPKRRSLDQAVVLLGRDITRWECSPQQVAHVIKPGLSPTPYDGYRRA
eukprot:203734-Chlamydomonas_euryale.AAC.1